MKRNDFINNIYSTPIREHASIMNALVTCLKPKEACDMLDFSFNQNIYLRNIIIRKIRSDIKKEFSSYHAKLINYLILGFNDNKSKKRSCAYCLSQLYPDTPAKLQKEILSLFLNHDSIVLRRYAYKLFDITKNDLAILEKAWESKQDFENAKILIKNSCVPFLKKHLLELEDIFLETPWFLGKLYLNIASKEKTLLKRLEKLDWITFAYVSTKLGVPLNKKRARVMFEEYKEHPNIGLFIWCLGQNGYWNLITEVANSYSSEKI